MGLSICRSIIEDHNGRLWVEPNKPAGAIFQFTLRAGGATSSDRRDARVVVDACYMHADRSTPGTHGDHPSSA
jgi:hypothetical protein